jgi:hypothetical protein
VGLTNKNVHSLALDSTGCVFATADSIGVFKSVDNGSNWILTGQGLSILESATQRINAALGGTIVLPSGSSVTIPPGTLTSDTTLTLQLLASMTNQPPSGTIQSVGTNLVLSFAVQPTGKESPLSQAQYFAPKDEGQSGSIQFTLKYGSTVPAATEGSVPMTDAIGSDGIDNFLGVPGNYSASTNTATISVPAQLLQNSKRIHASLANTHKTIDLLPKPGSKILNGSDWVDGLPGFNPKLKTLVLVHGLGASVEKSFGMSDNGTPNDPTDDYSVAQKIMQAGGYEQVVGFDYDWTQGIETSGAQLSDFLKTLKGVGLTSVDIEAHSEGVPVALAAASNTDLPIGNIIMLAGPIMGTPIATLAAGFQGGTINALETLFLNQKGLSYPPTPNLYSILNGQYASDLLPGSLVLSNIRGRVTKRMADPTSNLSSTKLVAIAATNYASSWDMWAMGPLKSLCGSEEFDGVICKSSELGENSGFDPARMTTMTYPISHTQVESDLNVIRDVGVLVSGSKVISVKLFDGMYTGTMVGSETVTIVTSEGSFTSTVQVGNPIAADVNNGVWTSSAPAVGTGIVLPSGNMSGSLTMNDHHYSFSGILVVTGGVAFGSGSWTDVGSSGPASWNGSGTWSATRH